MPRYGRGVQMSATEGNNGRLQRRRKGTMEGNILNGVEHWKETQAMEWNIGRKHMQWKGIMEGNRKQSKGTRNRKHVVR